MCNNCHSHQQPFSHLVTSLYPAIQWQFIRLASLPLQTGHRPFEPPVTELLAELKAEFQSLQAYEYRLVFPAVLSMLEQMDSIETKASLNDLLLLTAAKEQQIHRITEDLFDRYEPAGDGKINDALVELLRLFLHDFSSEKNKWAHYVQQTIEKSACHFTPQPKNHFHEH